MTTNRKNLPETRRRESNVSPFSTMGGFHNPFREMTRLQRGIDRLFEDFLAPVSNLIGEELAFSPACDIEDTDSHYIISFDLPGVSKDDLKIEVRDNQLIVSGQRQEEKVNRLSSERFHGTFQRSFMLPSSVDVEQVEANYQDGVLQVVIPKLEMTKGKVIEIKESKSGSTNRHIGQDKDVKTQKAA